MASTPQITDRARAYHERMFPGYVSAFLRTDPEFIERFDNFAFDEVVNEAAGGADLPERTRFIAILAVLAGSQAVEEFGAMVPAALNFGVSPTEVKELVYQASAYLGIGRAFPFLNAVNDALRARGIELPLPDQATTTPETRSSAGTEAQVAIFGERMRGFRESGTGRGAHINRWLTDHCFGDWYTRGGLSLADRELITFCLLYAQGGCEPQLRSHIAANIRLGTDADQLGKVVSQCVPFIGYPRSLNALACIEQVEQESQTAQA